MGRIVFPQGGRYSRMRIILLILAVMTCFPAAATAGDEEATPLRYASENGRADGVKRLLAAGANVNAKNASGVTPLQWAIYKGHADTVKLLMKAAGFPSAPAGIGKE